MHYTNSVVWRLFSFRNVAARVAEWIHGVAGCLQRLQGECMELHVTCKDIPFLLRGSVEFCNKKQWRRHPETSFLILVGKWSPKLGGEPHMWFFVAKSIFRLCLFLDIWIIVYKLRDAIYGWLVKLVKIDGPLFLDIGWFLFLDCQAKNRIVKYY